MNLSDLNSSPISAKTWLNPNVNNLTANNITANSVTFDSLTVDTLTTNTLIAGDAQIGNIGTTGSFSFAEVVTHSVSSVTLAPSDLISGVVGFNLGVTGAVTVTLPTAASLSAAIPSFFTSPLIYFNTYMYTSALVTSITFNVSGSGIAFFPTGSSRTFSGTSLQKVFSFSFTPFGWVIYC